MSGNYYLINSASPVVKGYLRSCIYDLQRHSHDVVPHSLPEFLKELEKKGFAELKRKTPKKFHDTLKEYLSYCLENEYVFELPARINKKQFKKIDFSYKSPSIITNMIIEINNVLEVSTEQIKWLIRAVKCYHLQFILKGLKVMSELKTMLEEISAIGLNSIELILPFKSEHDYNALIGSNTNISRIVVHSAPKTNTDHPQIQFSHKQPHQTNRKGDVEFRVNMSLFSESQKNNVYFNQKLYISSIGEIKNAPEDSLVHGNINDGLSVQQLLSLIRSSKFQKNWKITKDSIDVCKDCEFRYMCVDNRIPIKRNQKEWYFESECSYNPYIGKWKDEEGFIPLNQCGVESGKNGFTIDRHKLHNINTNTWGDE